MESFIKEIKETFRKESTINKYLSRKFEAGGDGFIQIAVRYLVSGMGIPGVAGSIDAGEIKLLAETLTKQTNFEEFGGFPPEKMIEIIESLWKDCIIIMPIGLKLAMASRSNWVKYIYFKTFKETYFVAQSFGISCPIITTKDEDMKPNEIIVFNKGGVEWVGREFENENRLSVEIKQVQINETEIKNDITIKTVSKIRLDPAFIKGIRIN